MTNEEFLKDLFVPIDIAKEVISLGFNEPCLGYYFPSGALITERDFSVLHDNMIPAPLWQQVYNWAVKQKPFDVGNGHVNWFADLERRHDYITILLMCVKDEQPKLSIKDKIQNAENEIKQGISVHRNQALISILKSQL